MSDDPAELINPKTGIGSATGARLYSAPAEPVGGTPCPHCGTLPHEWLELKLRSEKAERELAAYKDSYTELDKDCDEAEARAEKAEREVAGLRQTLKDIFLLIYPQGVIAPAGERELGEVAKLAVETLVLAETGLTERLAGLRTDAERYRWLRKVRWIDASEKAIDAEMTAALKEPKND